MKVLIVGNDQNIFDIESAVFKRSLDYARRLGELDIIVFSLASRPLSEVHVENLHIYPTNSSSKLWYVFNAISLGKKLIVEKGFVRGQDVLSAQDPFECGYVISELASNFRLPFQLQIHTDPYSPQFSHTILNWIRLRIAERIIPQAAGIRVVSEIVARSVQEHFSGYTLPLSVLPIVVSVTSTEATERRARSIRDRFSSWTTMFLMVSRVEKEKNIETALHALAVLGRKGMHAGLCIVGSGREEGELKARAAALGLSEQVVFVGWDQHPLAYYQAADAFIQTSLFEGYGMSTIEAASLLCPIITTPVGIMEFFARDGENALVCPVGDVECFASKMQDVIFHKEEARSRAVEMKKTLSSHIVSQEEYVTRYIDLLSHIASHVPHS